MANAYGFIPEELVKETIGIASKTFCKINNLDKHEEVSNLLIQYAKETLLKDNFF